MDLSKIEIPETAIVHIEHPTQGKLYDGNGRDKPCTITVYGPSSNQAIAQKRKSARRLQERLGKRGLKGLSQIPPDELEDYEVERLVALTAGVDNISYHGEVVTPQNIETLYRDQRMGWLRDQVATRLGDWEDFLG